MSIYQWVSFAADIAAVAGVVISVCVHKHIVDRDRRIETISIYNKIRNKFSSVSEESADDEYRAYLTEMEYFCVGINQGVYDVEILAKMSRKYLLQQYEYLQDYINRRRKSLQQNSAYSEYEQVMKKLLID